MTESLTLEPVVQRAAFVPAVCTLSDHSSDVVGVKFLDKGGVLQLVSASKDGTTLIHDFSRSQEEGEPAKVAAHGGPSLTSLAVSAEGHVASCGDVGQLRMWHFDTDETIARPSSRPSPVASVDVTPRGEKVVIAYVDGTIVLYSMEHKSLVEKDCKYLETEVFCIKFSPDAVELAVSTETDIHIYSLDICSLARVRTISDAHRYTIMSLVWSPDGKMIMSGSFDRQIRVWDTTSSEQVKEPFCGHLDGIYWLALSPNGRVLASASRDCTVGLWDVESRQLISILAHSHAVYCAEFAPNSESIVTAHNNAIMLWDTSKLDILTLPSQARWDELSVDWVITVQPGLVQDHIPLPEAHTDFFLRNMVETTMDRDIIAKRASDRPQRRLNLGLLRPSTYWRRRTPGYVQRRGRRPITAVAMAHETAHLSQTLVAGSELHLQTTSTSALPDFDDLNENVGCFTFLMRKTRLHR